MRTEIAIFGGLLLDQYFGVDRWPEREQDGFITDEAVFVGGCAVNMAVTAQNLGARVHVVSTLGNDAAGDDIREYLRSHRMSGWLTETVPGSTGRCLVFTEPGGERTFLTRTGIENRFSPALAEAVTHLAPGVVGITGYNLLSPDAGRILDCLEWLHGGGTRILFDPSPLAGDIPAERLHRILAISEVITPNRSELPALGGEEAIARFTAASKTVILKKGSEGGTVYAPEENYDYASVHGQIVDTTGAGDSFAGALLYGMAQNWPLRRSVELAAKCAAKTITIRGPHGFWDPEEVL